MATAPSDVLCCVFELLPFAERVCATHVCKHWRMASLSSPGTLWSRVVFTGHRDGVLRQLLDRSQQAPVDVEILLRGGTFEDAMSAISKHLFHIRRLHLYSEGDLAMRDIPRVYDALAVPAPILEHLDIGIAVEEIDPEDYDSDDTVDTELEDIRNFDCRIPANLFAGHAPCLQRVASRSMILPPGGIPAFADITHFSFEGRTLSASHLAAIVSTLPRLTSLHLKVDYGYDLPPTSPSAALCLDELELEVWDHSLGQTPAALLRYLGCQHARLVTTDRLPEWLELAVAPPRGLPHALCINDRWTVATSWRMEHVGGYVSQGYSLFTKEILPTPLARDVFSALETFVAHISIIAAPEDGIPPLPQLARLVLYCHGREDVRRLFAAVFDSAHPFANARLRCPQLRTLEIRGVERDSVLDYRPTLSVGDAELLVENVFVPTPDPRPHLTLRHVDVPFPRPERFWGSPIADALTITQEHAPMPMHWEGSDWNVRIGD